MGIPLWGLWGGADVQKRETDVTLPIGETEAVVATARDWYQQGFRILKMKVGHGVEDDIRRVEAVAAVCHEASFVIDANQGYGLDQAQEFILAMERLRIPVRVFEQPLHRDHPGKMAMLKKQSRIPLAADESLRSLEDARQLIAQKAVDIFNLKITKCGVIESVRIAEVARASGVRLMIGGMVESRVAMGCSWSLVLGLGGRLAAFILLCMTLVIQFTYQHAIEHFYWAVLCLIIMLQGPGKLSVDYVLRQKYLKNLCPECKK